jgi:hypothetical protein
MKIYRDEGSTLVIIEDTFIVRGVPSNQFYWQYFGDELTIRTLGQFGDFSYSTKLDDLEINGINATIHNYKDLLNELYLIDNQTSMTHFIYSFDEQFTGNYWLDNKKIYQKTIKIDSTLFSETWSGTIDVAHNIQNISEFVDIKTISGDPSNNNNTITNIIFASTSNASFFTSVDNTNIKIVNTGNRTSSTNTYITLQYTCTDK